MSAGVIGDLKFKSIKHPYLIGLWWSEITKSALEIHMFERVWIGYSNQIDYSTLDSESVGTYVFSQMINTHALPLTMIK